MHCFRKFIIIIIIIIKCLDVTHKSAFLLNPYPANVENTVSS